MYEFVTKEDLEKSFRSDAIFGLVERLLRERDAYRQVAIDYACEDDYGVHKSVDEVRTPQVDALARALLAGKEKLNG